MPEQPSTSLQSAIPKKKRSRAIARISNLVGRASRAWTVLLIFILLSVLAWLTTWRIYPKVSARRALDNTQFQESGKLLLQVYPYGNGLKVGWDSSSTLIQQSDSGTVHILDGRQQLDIPIDAVTLRLGHLAYTPLTNEVRIEMTVRGKGGAEVGDSVHLIDGQGLVTAQALAKEPEFSSPSATRPELKDVEPSPTLPKFTLAMPPIEQLHQPPIAAQWHPVPPDMATGAPN